MQEYELRISKADGQPTLIAIGTYSSDSLPYARRKTSRMKAKRLKSGEETVAFWNPAQIAQR